MKLIEIKDLTKKDIPLFYRNEYTGYAIFEDREKNHVERRVEFVIEMQPTGQKDITIEQFEELGYPLIPIIRDLKNHILELDKNGKLP